MKLRLLIILGLTVFLCALLWGALQMLAENITSRSGAEEPLGQWHEIRKGLAYADISVRLDAKNSKNFFVAKIDPKLFEFRIFQNAAADSAKELQDIQKEKGAVLVFNGAFFDTNFKAMGLLQDSQARLHGKTASQLMNGVFFIDSQGVAGVKNLSAVTNDENDSGIFMIQNGPILLDADQKIPILQDTKKLAGRTALGVDAQGNVILIILHSDLLNTENTLSLYRFAHMLKETSFFADMGLHDVLNLDGGPSTGVMIDHWYLPELSPIQNAIFVLPRG